MKGRKLDWQRGRKACGTGPMSGSGVNMRGWSTVATSKLEQCSPKLGTISVMAGSVFPTASLASGYDCALMSARQHWRQLQADFCGVHHRLFPHP